MAKQAHRKPITIVSKVERYSDSDPALQRSDFDNGIYNQGTELTLEEAHRCPCSVEASGHGLSNCKNCFGVGFFFTDKKSTRALVQNLNRQKKYVNWTEEDRGTISVTARSIDRFAFMDRIVLTEYQSFYSQVVYMEIDTALDTDGHYKGYSMYYPIEVQDCFLFVEASQKLRKLEIGTEFEFTENRLRISPSVVEDSLAPPKKLKISIRYSFHPQYHVIDVLRDQSLRRGGEDDNCDVNDPSFKKMSDFPVNAIARLAHYILDAPSYQGDDQGLSVFDNS